MGDRDELALRVEAVMERELARFAATVPRATHLVDDGTPLDEAYYVRHRIETIKRIRLTSRIDALALASLVDEDYEDARRWARYTAQELSHDRLFLKDLRRHGLDEAAVLAVPPFPATRALIAYLTDRVQRVGAVAAIAYSLFVEWNSARVSAQVVRRAGARFSPAHVVGARAHLGIDVGHEHYQTMLDLARRVIARAPDREPALLELLHDVAGFLSDYFRELDAGIAAPAAEAAAASA